MKKIIPLLLVLVLCLSACSGETIISRLKLPQMDAANKAPETEAWDGEREVVFPKSLLSYSITDAETIAEMYRGDTTFCQDAYVRGEDTVLLVTQEQFNNLWKNNEQNLQDIRDELAAEGQGYWLEESGDYTWYKYYCDEKVPVILNLKVLQGISGYYGVAQVLQGNLDWSVELTVINCHTNKVVASFSCPNEEDHFDMEDWAESYKVD